MKMAHGKISIVQAQVLKEIMVQKTKVQVQHQLLTEETVQAVYIIQPMQQAEVAEEMYQALTDTMEHSMEQVAAEQR